jgi:DNA-3-methyladenine glycosylase II
LLFCLRHSDAWPAGDLAVQEGLRLGLGACVHQSRTWRF